MPRIVGCVGVGIMGSRMCKNLLKAGFQVVAYDLVIIGDVGSKAHPGS